VGATKKQAHHSLVCPWRSCRFAFVNALGRPGALKHSVLTTGPHPEGGGYSPFKCNYPVP